MRLRLDPLIISLALVFVLISPFPVFAQDNNRTAREEAEGKEIFNKLQTRQIECKNLSEDNFQALGEYYMGQMVGASHEQMNQIMTRMTGEEGEKQMHVAMGKRLSGCDTSAQLPQNGVGFMPMMWMMGSAFAPGSFGGTRGGGNSMMGTGWGNMTGGWNDFGVFGWLSMILFWALLILGVVSLIRYIVRSGQTQEGKTSLEILKERYARGEIDKKEFEDRKKDLS